MLRQEGGGLFSHLEMKNKYLSEQVGEKRPV